MAAHNPEEDEALGGQCECYIRCGNSLLTVSTVDIIFRVQLAAGHSSEQEDASKTPFDAVLARCMDGNEVRSCLNAYRGWTSSVSRSEGSPEDEALLRWIEGYQVSVCLHHAVLDD